QTREEKAKTDLQDQKNKHYKSVQEHKEQRREAIKKLLEHTTGNIPEFFNTLSAELREVMRVDKKLELDEPLKFSEETASFRIPKFAESFNLDGSSDFFGMTIGEQELLYDRVGLFKGIVVDHTKETPVDQGYRDVVKFLAEAGESTTSKPVKVFYKKPRLSGFFESTFSMDESQRKAQETGIFNVGLGLSVDYSALRTSVAVRGGYSYGKDWMKETAVHRKQVDITSSFFLPKIELSFDTLAPCA
ncbi:MAG: hypothetical protein V4616_11540, partial [Bacteroidota bacterium]